MDFLFLHPIVASEGKERKGGMGYEYVREYIQFRISKQKKRLKWRVMGFCLPEDRMSSIQSQIFNKTIKMGKWGKKIRNNDFCFSFPPTHFNFSNGEYATLQIQERPSLQYELILIYFPIFPIIFSIFQ